MIDNVFSWGALFVIAISILIIVVYGLLKRDGFIVPNPKRRRYNTWDEEVENRKGKEWYEQ